MIGNDNNSVLRAYKDGIPHDLDLTSQLPIRVNISAVENTEIGQLFGISSQKIVLPGTKNNNAFFNNAYNVGSNNIPGFFSPVRCEIISNSEIILEGDITLDNIIADENGYILYETTVSNNFIGFKDVLKNKLISEIDFSEYIHDYSPANVTGSWENELFDGDIFYPLVDQGMDQYHNENTFGFVQASGINTGFGSFDKTLTPMVIEQFQPAIRVKVVMGKIFKQAGFSYSSNFLSSADFNNIYVLPKADTFLGIASDQGQSVGFISKPLTTYNNLSGSTSPSAVTIARVRMDSETFDPDNNYNTSTYTYTTPIDGIYQFEGNILLENQFNNPEAEGITQLALIIGVYDTSVSVINDNAYAIDSVIVVQNVTPNTSIKITTPNLTLPSGTEVTMMMRVQNITATKLNTWTVNPYITSFKTLYTPIDWSTTSTDIAGEFDAKAKSLDFVKGIFEKFNLIASPSPTDINGNLINKHFIIEPYNDFINNGEIKDWTAKYDASKRVSISNMVSDQPSIITFTDEDDTDRLSQESKDNNPNEQYGTHEYNSPSSISNGTRKIGSFFAPIIPATILTDTSTNTTVNINNGIPHLYQLDGDKPRKTIKFKPKLGYRRDNMSVAGLANNSSEPSFLFGGQNFTTFSTLSNRNNDIVPKDLWYSSQVGNETDNAYKLYWSNYIDGLYWDESRKVTLDILFMPHEYKDISLNDKIFIKDQLYRINKITGFNLNQKAVTKVELIRLYTNTGYLTN